MCNNLLGIELLTSYHLVFEHTNNLGYAWGLLNRQEGDSRFKQFRVSERNQLRRGSISWKRTWEIKFWLWFNKAMN